MYVFDEPDASLDIMNQKELISIYKNIMAGNIGIFITHKVHYVSLVAEMIYVLQQGEITERGKHEELLSNKGIYYMLFRNCNNTDERSI